MTTFAFFYLNILFCPLQASPPESNNFKMGRALSSSLKLEPFADLFWLSALHVRIFQLAYGGGVDIFL